MAKVLVTTVPFCEYSKEPIELLQKSGIEYVVNPIGRKLKASELAEMVKDYDGIIAGTEEINLDVFKDAKNLRAISRVGVGLDSVDLLAARDHGVRVSYTPEAPAPAVAELTLGLMLGILRNIGQAHEGMRQGKWKRFFGRRIEDSVVGLVGCGRIGHMVAELLKPFKPKKIIYADPIESADKSLEQVNLKTLMLESDIISVHAPLKKDTWNLINATELNLMKKSAVIINTARGGIINEDALFSALQKNTIAGAAVDVFTVEPYPGPLKDLPNCLLTSHMGSMAIDCRTRMEVEATEDMVHFLKHGQFLREVPESEYELRK